MSDHLNWLSFELLCHQFLQFGFQGQGFFFHFRKLLRGKILFPFFMAKIVDFVVFDSSNDVKLVFAQNCQEKLLFWGLFEKKVGTVSEKVVNESREVKFTFDYSWISLKKFFHGWTFVTASSWTIDWGFVTDLGLVCARIFSEVHIFTYWFGLTRL